MHRGAAKQTHVAGFAPSGGKNLNGEQVSRSPAVNVQTFINEHPFSGFQWLIFTMRFVIVLLDGFDTAAIGFIAVLSPSRPFLSRANSASSWTVTKTRRTGRQFFADRQAQLVHRPDF